MLETQYWQISFDKTTSPVTLAKCGLSYFIGSAVFIVLDLKIILAYSYMKAVRHTTFMPNFTSSRLSHVTMRIIMSRQEIHVQFSYPLKGICTLFVFCKHCFGALLENAVWVCCGYTETAALVSCAWRGWDPAR